MNPPPVIGIHDLAVATGSRVLDLADGEEDGRSATRDEVFAPE